MNDGQEWGRFSARLLNVALKLCPELISVPLPLPSELLFLPLFLLLLWLFQQPPLDLLFLLRPFQQPLLDLFPLSSGLHSSSTGAPSPFTGGGFLLLC